MNETKAIDHDAAEVQQPLRRSDMTKPGALEVFRERGAVSTTVPTANLRGGLRYENAGQMMEAAKMMALADKAVPSHLRGNPGACLRIVMQADEWGVSCFALADQSYLVNDRIAYMSQAIHAVIERHAPLKGRLRMTYEGEGGDLTCTVIGELLGEEKPFIWTSPKIKDIKIKNSPEWTNNPKKQLFFHTSRDWARIHCPDVLLGIYSRDELGADYGSDRTREIEGGQSLADRLPAETGDRPGFDSDGIATQLKRSMGAPAEAAGEPAASEQQNDTESQPANSAPAQPTTEAEYVTHAESWFAKAAIREDAYARWDGERELRAACKMSVKRRKELERKLAEKFPEGA